MVKVNLSSGRVAVEDTPRDFVDAVGGKMFAARFFHEHVRPEDPFDPDNVLMLAAGPACGTRLPMASKLGLYFISPLTNLFGESYMGGNIMAEMKWAGVDAIIVTGRSDRPVYIYIHDYDVEIRDAGDLWGLTTSEAERRIKEEVGYADASVAVIGPAGEKLVRFANVSHNSTGEGRESKAGRLGAGAVMGSKRLKAIAVKASGRGVEVYDEDGLARLARRVVGKISEDPIGTGAKNYRTYGTPGTLFAGLAKGFFSSHYFGRCGSPYAESLNPEVLRERFYKRSVACYNCPLSCGKITVVEEGPYKGTRVKGPEYETIFAFGGLNDIADYAAIAKINRVCDELGVDTIEMGNVAALTLYAVEKGRLKLEGFRFGDPESVLRLVEMAATRDGIGDKLAEGVARFAREAGLEDIAVHVKGLSPPGYDPRVLNTMALEYCVSDRGADHLRMTAYAYEILGKLEGLKGPEDVVAFLVDVEDRNIVADSMILCRFSRFIYGWGEVVEALRCITGVERGVEDLRKAANEARTRIRLLNIARGLKPEVDDDLPPRFYNEAVEFQGKTYRLERGEVRRMVREYYRLRGWDGRGYPREGLGRPA